MISLVLFLIWSICGGLLVATLCIGMHGFVVVLLEILSVSLVTGVSSGCRLICWMILDRVADGNSLGCAETIPRIGGSL